MYKKIGLIFSMIIAFNLLLSMPAASINAAEEIDIWSKQTIQDNQKVWTIEFSQPLKSSSIKSTTVYVDDENYHLFMTNVTLSDDNKSIIVTPRGTYQQSKTYRLHIKSDVTSAKGKKLEKSIIMPFVVNGTTETTNSVQEELSPESAVKSVEIRSNNFATMITVVSNGAVSEVKANSKEMLYAGNNTYQIGLTELSSGDSIKIQAYDTSGKRVYSESFNVK